MVYKVYYQEDKKRNPKREDTHALYVEAATEVEARAQVEAHTEHNIEFIEAIEGSTLAYEQQNPAYKLTEFGE
ncbi:MAG TPA: DNA-dependent RNA polymerase auxiliary subunit epsilon family protein [Candidatus Levilactobacillus faecigallinarum]|uniref:DNA-directed RNA polymerase subunit epsilon n=1 Tax=Candidatus Levilactobacillus faecigallinarum TaxID=2838638 RepID=A0A9D1QSB6_9LACO|nr:DNA-dependent RNA polymerase auxiliary subunit epsilon family protein [Candidatus Levilactobacillus faecigallinarum]